MNNGLDVFSRKPQAIACPGDPVPFKSNLELLDFFITHRRAITDRIDQLLNSQKKPIEYQQDQATLARQFKDCFFALSDISREQLQLRDALELAHWQHGFKPRANPGNDIIDPVVLMTRAFHLWRQTRWPGQKGRSRYAHTLFNVYLVRCLALLTMRLWHEGEDVQGVGERLAQAQDLLDALWRSSPPDQPVLVRDVRWLIPVAISPTTDELGGYFEVAQKVVDTFSEADQIETQKAWVQTAGGHLRSQLRHLSVQKNVAMDEHGLLLVTRMSNTLDIALLMQGLVVLLRAYQRAVQQHDKEQRLVLASAVLQGLSPDPELFVNRVDLLGPYSMMEYLFINIDSEGHASYTAMGKRHLQLLKDYKTLITALAAPLLEDFQRTVSQPGSYSPYGALYGFSSNILELIAFRSLQLDCELRFSMEDVFTAGASDKIAWVNEWRNLPHIQRQVVKQFEYPAEFVRQIHLRIEQALQRLAAHNAPHTGMGRLHAAPVTESAGHDEQEHDEAQDDLSRIPELPSRYILSSDPVLIQAEGATPRDEQDLLYCRLEGEFLVSYPSAGGWVGISKDVLTDMLAKGHDARLRGLPVAAAETLRLMLVETDGA